MFAIFLLAFVNFKIMQCVFHQSNFQDKIISFKTQQQGDHNLYMIVFIYGKEAEKEDKKLIQIIKQVKKGTEVKKRNFNFALFSHKDYKKFAEPYQNFQYPKQQMNLAIFYYGYNILMPDFNLIYDQDDLEVIVQKINNFIKKITENTVKQIQNYQEIQLLLNRYDNIFLFLGNNSKNFLLYKITTDFNYGERFYYTFNRDIIQQIQNKYKVFDEEEEYSEGEAFIILRNTKSLNNIEKMNMNRYDGGLSNFQNTRNFIQLQKLKKLTQSPSDDFFVKQILGEYSIMILYVYDQENEQEYQEFKNAIQKIPRHFLFVSIRLEDEQMQKMKVLFELAKKYINKKNVYIIQRNKNVVIKNCGTSLKEQQIFDCISEYHSKQKMHQYYEKSKSELNIYQEYYRKVGIYQQKVNQKQFNYILYLNLTFN